jgi:hypothetical protein
MSTPTTPPIDYKDLLRKYMQHILDIEGITFLRFTDDSNLTEAELAALQSIADDLGARDE